MARRKEPVEPPDIRRLARLLFQIVNEIGPRRFQRRPEAEKHRGEKTKEERNSEHARIGLHIDHGREARRSEERTKGTEQRTVAPDAQKQAESSPRQSEKKSFAQKLADDTPAAFFFFFFSFFFFFFFLS